MKESLINEIADALQITSGCSPIQPELDAMPDDQEVTLTFCALDLKEVRLALAQLRVMQAKIKHAEKLNREF